MNQRIYIPSHMTYGVFYISLLHGSLHLSTGIYMINDNNNFSSSLLLLLLLLFHYYGNSIGFITQPCPEF